jgi:hypothetical protein
MHFHLGWSRPTQSFVHGGYYVGDGHYGYVGHQQGRGASGQENRTVRNAKPDHPVFEEATTTLGYQQEQRAPNEPPVDQLGSNQEKTGMGSEISAGGEAKPDMEKNPEEAVAEQSNVLGAKAETRIEAGVSSW